MRASPDTDTRRLTRNIRLYPWIQAAFNALFWVPVFFLFFLSRLDFSQALLLEAVYYGAFLVVEVPSGYLSDKRGRRTTLLLGAVSLCLAYVVFVSTTSFAAWMVAQVFLATGIGFASGTDTSMHYDSLEALGREAEYEALEARAHKFGFAAMGLSALGGGLLGSLDLRLPYAAAGVAAVVLLGLVAATVEPPRGTPAERHLGAQLSRAASYLTQRPILWLGAFYVVATTLNHLPYELYQPYLEKLRSTAFEEVPTAAVAGVHAFAAGLIASLFAAWSARFRDLLGLRALLIGATLWQVALLGLVALYVHPMVALVLVSRSAPGAVARAPLNAALSPRIASEHRATFLSLLSLAGRVGFGLTLASLSAAAGLWGSDLQTTAAVAAAGGALASSMLMLTAGALAHQVATTPR